MRKVSETGDDLIFATGAEVLEEVAHVSNQYYNGIA